MAALTRRGDVLTWGAGSQGQLGRVAPYDASEPQPDLQVLLTPTPVADLAAAIGPDIADISCGAYSTFAVSRRGAVAAWGLNNAGQLGVPATQGLSVREFYADVAAKRRGGEGGAVAAANRDSAEAAAVDDLKQEEWPEAGQPVAYCLWMPAPVPLLRKGVAAVAGGPHHTLFLTKQHEVMACGAHNYGMLGRKVRAAC